ncbi:MAG TPA: tetratricopeptide repeat protein [Saprospiraceae bacterium]|nr:tetratricopeptide repeat protein [Saprospiraceae bacterium]HPI06773.1 tetratricopeptide repeat protein [Saprospiraceae bacterium]
MRKHLLFVLATTAFFACKQDPNKKITDLEQKLVTIDKEIGGAKSPDKEKAAQFIQTSEELAALLQPTDPDKYATVMLKAAGLAKSVENPAKAIELYAKVSEGLPQHPKAPTALFMQAFIYENDLGNLQKAKSTYESFLQRYPNDADFADDAQNSLKMLGKSPEEIIKEFEKLQQEVKTQ